MAELITKAPGPAGSFALGVLPALRRDPLRFVVKAARAYGDVVRFRLGPKNLFLLNHPSLVEHVLLGNAQNYRKSQFYERLKPLFGEGLIVSEGAEWRSQRSAAAPAFCTESLKRIAGQCTELTSQLLDRLEACAAAGTPVDVSVEMMRLTLGVVLAGLFTTRLNERDGDELFHAITVVLRAAEHRIWSVNPFVGVVPTAGNRRYHRALSTLDRFVYRIITEHRVHPERYDDLLSMMMAARHSETKQPYADKQLRDQIVFMILAGHETTASALAWTWYLLSSHPEVARRLSQEHAGQPDGPPEFEDLAGLPYTQMVFEEAMRLYPPAWTISRTALEADELGGYAVPKGTSVMVCPYVVHRDERFWRNPEAFDPERFKPEAAKARPRFAYFPFSGGPRACIGSRFAMTEAKIILAMVSRRFSLHLVPGQAIEVEPMISLRPRHGLFMTPYRTGPLRQAA